MSTERPSNHLISEPDMRGDLTMLTRAVDELPSRELGSQSSMVVINEDESGFNSPSRLSQNEAIAYKY